MYVYAKGQTFEQPINDRVEVNLNVGFRLSNVHFLFQLSLSLSRIRPSARERGNAWTHG